MAKKISRVGKWLSGLALLVSSLVPGIHGKAQAEEFPSEGTTRTRVENTQNDRGTNITKFTLGYAPVDIEKAPTIYDETFRLYHSRGQVAGKDIDSTQVGVMLPSFNFAGVKSQATLFGEHSSVNGKETNGVGVASTHTIGKFDALLNAEVKGQDHRIGAGVDYNVNPDLKFGIGIDKTRIAGEDTTHLLGNVKAGIGKNYYTGLGISSSSDGKKSATVFLERYGKDLPWGFRFYNRFDKDSSSKGISGELILAQNPTFSRASCEWMASRACTDMYDRGLGMNPLGDEATPLAARTRGGLVGKLGWVMNDNGATKYGCYDLEGGYRFTKKFAGAQPTLTLFGKREENGDDKKNSAGLGLVLSARDWAVTLRGYKSVSGENDSGAYLSIMKKW